MSKDPHSGNHQDFLVALDTADKTLARIRAFAHKLPPADVAAADTVAAMVDATRGWLEGRVSEAEVMRHVTVNRRAIDARDLPIPEVSEAARLLAVMTDVIAMETNLARAPIWVSGRSRGPVQLSLERMGFLYGRPFNVLEPQGPLTVQDAALLAHLIKRYAEDGFPADRRIRMSLSEAARAAGYRHVGGRQRDLVRRAFARMRATTYQHTALWPDGTQRSLTWGLIDWAATWEPTEAAGRALVTLSEPLVALVRAGSLVYLQEDLFAELLRRDEYAARLWIFLESETLSAPRDYLLFSAKEGEPERERHTPAIADLLRLADWNRRRKVKDRVQKAAEAVAEVDPHYSLRVVRAEGKGMWKLQVRRGRGPADESLEGGTSRGATGYFRGRDRVLPGAEAPYFSPQTLRF